MPNTAQEPFGDRFLIRILRQPRPFNHYVFVENDADCVGALSQRWRAVAPTANVHIVPKNVNESIPDVRAKLPPSRGLLSFCFVDPFNTGVRFETIRALTDLRIDFLILLMLGNDARRNFANYFWDPTSNRIAEFMATLFVFYLANYFVIVFFNVALVGVANSRLTGGNWTFDQGLQLAWTRKWVILQWAFVAATVGMALRLLSERASFVGRIVISIIGVAWNVACYFVVPVLAFEDVSPGGALYRSAELFTETWGERVVGGFSLGIIFMLLMLPGALVWIGMINVAGPKGLVAGGIIMAAYVLLLSVVSSAVQGIFNAALYRYACDQAAPLGFSKGLIESAWQARD